MKLNLKNINKHCIGALGVLVLVLVAAYLSLVRPVLLKYASYDEHIEQQRDHLERYARMMASKPSMEAELSRVNAAQAKSAHYLEQRSPALAATELQEKVEAAVEPSGGKIKSVQVLQAQDQGGFVRVPLKLQISGDMEALSEVLYALESTEPLLFIDDVSIVARAIRRRVRKGTPAQTRNELTIQCEVAGYMRKEGA